MSTTVKPEQVSKRRIIVEMVIKICFAVSIIANTANIFELTKKVNQLNYTPLPELRASISKVKDSEGNFIPDLYAIYGSSDKSQSDTMRGEIFSTVFDNREVSFVMYPFVSDVDSYCYENDAELFCCGTLISDNACFGKTLIFDAADNIETMKKTVNIYYIFRFIEIVVVDVIITLYVFSYRYFGEQEPDITSKLVYFVLPYGCLYAILYIMKNAFFTTLLQTYVEYITNYRNVNAIESNNNFDLTFVQNPAWFTVLNYENDIVAIVGAGVFFLTFFSVILAYCGMRSFEKDMAEAKTECCCFGKKQTAVCMRWFPILIAYPTLIPLYSAIGSFTMGFGISLGSVINKVLNYPEKITVNYGNLTDEIFANLGWGILNEILRFIFISLVFVVDFTEVKILGRRIF